MTEELVVVKLVDGDQLIGQLLNHTNEGVLILQPISIKLHPIVTDGGELVERLTTSVYCPLSDEESFVFDNRHVLYVNKLHENMVDQYWKLSKELYKSLKNPNNFSSPKKNEPEEYVEKSDKKITFH